MTERAPLARVRPAAGSAATRAQGGGATGGAHLLKGVHEVVRPAQSSTATSRSVSSRHDIAGHGGAMMMERVQRAVGAHQKYSLACSSTDMVLTAL